MKVFHFAFYALILLPVSLACSHDASSRSGFGRDLRLPVPAHLVSRSLVLTSNDEQVWAVDTDADAVSIIDTRSRAVVDRIALGPTPTVDSAGRYEPRVSPRGLVFSSGETKLFVAGQSANRIFVIDVASRAVTKSIEVGAEPVSVIADADGRTVYAVSYQAGVVTKIDTESDAVVSTLAVGEHPFAASLSRDGETLFVTQFLVDPGVFLIDVKSFTKRGFAPLVKETPTPWRSKLVPNGEARGLYAVVPNPATGELWVPHLLLSVDTAQPALDFESSVFPTISALTPAGVPTRRIRFKPLAVPLAIGEFTDSVSGFRDIAFTPDGSMALVACAQSEDVLVLDGTTGNEIGLVRPVPTTMIEGIVVDSAGATAYVLGRNNRKLAVLSIDKERKSRPVLVDGEAIALGSADPMPAEMRIGQRLFYSANSAAIPFTKNFWIACSSCHLEGGSDAVTWLFKQGPRDTPSNAGGVLNTGFLLRQASRTSLFDYDETINVEQGGAVHKTNPMQRAQLAALARYVNYGIPFPQNPNRPSSMPVSVFARGKQLFDARCASCHSGDYFTDSGKGNPTLDLAGPVLLHNVATCASGLQPDRPATDVDGHARTACDFDTPTLRGVFATAPYLHDGSAATLTDATRRMPGGKDLSESDLAALVKYVSTL